MVAKCPIFDYSKRIMTDLGAHLKTHPLVYINLDIERTLGIDVDTPGFYIVTNATTLAKEYADRTNILLIDEGRILSTRELVMHPETEAFLKNIDSPSITVFKNTSAIQKVCKEKGWNLLNPDAALIKQVEDKISQVAWLEDLVNFLPDHQVTTVEQLAWQDSPFVLQYNSSHTGNGTFLIDSEEKLIKQKETFPKRDVRTLAFVTGPTYTVNAVVFDDTVSMGNISYQITGISPFTDHQFATIGNDWGLPYQLMTAAQEKVFSELTHAIGKKLQQEGYRGAFGIDTIVNTETGKLHLIEINARQPASIPTETYLQQQSGQDGMTIFEAHVSAMMGLTAGEMIEMHDGGQLIQRVTEIQKEYNPLWAEALKDLKEVMSIPSPGTTPGAELLRIRSTKSVMKEHGQFNKLGDDIVRHIS